MSQNPYLTLVDCSRLKDAGRFYLDYLHDEGIKKADPKQYEEARQAYLHMCDVVQLWSQYPYQWDAMEIKAPNNALPRNVLR